MIARELFTVRENKDRYHQNMDNMTTLAHNIRLTPTPEQVISFKKACGTARFVYNWALQEWQTQYRTGGQPSALGLKTRGVSVGGRRHEMRSRRRVSESEYGVHELFCAAAVDL